MRTERDGFAGVISSLATPFYDDESLDLESLDRLVRFHGAIAVDGISILSEAGEEAQLTDEERTRIIRVAVKAAGETPVLVGTSHAGTTATVSRCQQAMELGAAGVIVSPWAAAGSNDDTALEQVARIGASVPARIILQDQACAGRDRPAVQAIARILDQVPSVVSVQTTGVPSGERVRALKCEVPLGRATVLSGLGSGATYALFDLEQGADGFHAMCSFPEVLISIVHAMRMNTPDAARQVYGRFLPLLVFEQQEIGVCKEILKQRGCILSNRVRHPADTIGETTAAQLRRLLHATFSGEDITVPVQGGALRPFLVNV